MSKVQQNQAEYQERVKNAKIARDNAQNELSEASKDYYQTNYEYESVYTKYQSAMSNERTHYSSDKEWESAKSGVSYSLADKFGIGKMKKTKFNTSLNFDLALDGARRSNDWLAKLNTLSIFIK